MSNKQSNAGNTIGTCVMIAVFAWGAYRVFTPTSVAPRAWPVAVNKSQAPSPQDSSSGSKPTPSYYQDNSSAALNEQAKRQADPRSTDSGWTLRTGRYD